MKPMSSVLANLRERPPLSPRVVLAVRADRLALKHQREAQARAENPSLNGPPRDPAPAPDPAAVSLAPPHSLIPIPVLPEDRAQAGEPEPARVRRQLFKPKPEVFFHEFPIRSEHSFGHDGAALARIRIGVAEPPMPDHRKAKWAARKQERILAKLEGRKSWA